MPCRLRGYARPLVGGRCFVEMRFMAPQENEVPRPGEVCGDPDSVPDTAAGLRRSRLRVFRNRWRVRLVDGVARSLITVGGIGTIIAVSGVFLFLLWTVIPLFRPGRMEPASAEFATDERAAAHDVAGPSSPPGSSIPCFRRRACAKFAGDRRFDPPRGRRDRIEASLERCAVPACRGQRIRHLPLGSG